MSIQSVQGIQGYKNAARVTRKQRVARPSETRAPVKDSYESSSVSDRAELLKAVKNRIKSGYYNSREVVEDLSDSFAKAFDQLT